MRYRVEYTRQAVEDLRRLNRPARGLVYGWISKNLVHCEDPRRVGDGDPEGGRWRYCVGEYRLIAEIEAGRIVILAVNTGVGLQHANGSGPNVFLRSTLRQPVKTALLLAVTALMAFAFVARTAEYLLVRQETGRLGKYYQAVGTLEPTAWNQKYDTTGAVFYLKADPSVEFVDTYHYTSAVMEEFCNADTDLLTSDMGRYMAFYGTLQSYSDTYFYFTVDTVLTGLPEYIHEDYAVILHPTEFQDVADPGRARSRLVKGARYLAVGYYSLQQPSYIEYECDSEHEATSRATGIHAMLSCPLEDSYFYPVPEGQEADWSDPRLAELGPFIQAVRNEQHALNIIPTRDMSALPIIQDTDPQIYLADGRWLDSQDDAAGSRVCVISQALASLRGLAVGDQFTLTLRDIPSAFGYFRPNPIATNQFRLQRPLEVTASGAFLGNPMADTRHLYVSPGQVQTATDSYEIVGIYDYGDKYQRTVTSNFAYVPASVVPEGFAMTTPETLDEVETLRMKLLAESVNLSTQLPTPGSVSFVLASPDEEARFMAGAREEMAAMGFQVEILENGWDSFQATARPMGRASLYNAAIFSAVLVAALGMAALAYFRMRRKEIAIARAMGTPLRRCAGQAACPLLLVGTAGIACGGALGWRYTMDNAGEILQALDAFGGGGTVTLPVYWLAVLWAVAAGLLLAVTLGGAWLLASHPVLELLQGGAAAKQVDGSAALAQEAAAPIAPPVLATAPIPRAQAQRSPASGGDIRHILRFVWRHMVRSKLKSALSILLAVGFTAGLAAIRFSIVGSREKVDWLYEHTEVEAELALEVSNQFIQGGGFLRQDVLDQLMASGCVTHAYLEGSTNGAVVKYDPALEGTGAKYITDDIQIKKTVRAFDDETVFLSPAGSGGGVTITYLDGWDGSLFAQDWSGGNQSFPLILPKAVYDEYGSGPDHTVGFFCKSFWICQVAGYYEGAVAGETGETDPILLPLSAYQAACGNRMATYTKAHVTLDPALNRELGRFHDVLSSAAAAQSGMVSLRAVIWDEELRLAVAPLENSIELMEVLYPVTLTLSLLVAAGLAVLFVMTSAREAAILRVLGTSKLRSRVMLALQNVLTSLSGLLLGLLGVLAYTSRTRPELLASLVGASVLCAVLYLLAAIIGAGASAVAVTHRNPLELLQVRE